MRMTMLYTSAREIPVTHGSADITRPPTSSTPQTLETPGLMQTWYMLL